jgi:hypothetical protein
VLNENDRLTHEHANGWFVKTGQPVAKYWSSANKARLIQRVGEYEDTGYSPEEIKGFLAKYKTRIGDYVEYMGTLYEVIDFSHNFAHNLVHLQSVNDDRHHEVDLPVFLFSVDYQRKVRV